jgi:hypothetical protein
VLEGLLEIPAGSRFSDLERWRKGPADPTAKRLRLALRRVAEIHGLDLDASRAREVVPTRRPLELACYELRRRHRGSGAIPRRGGQRRWRQPWRICRQPRLMTASSCSIC